MSKLTRIEALENGRGIQYLLDSAYKIFNDPIYIYDENFRLIAYTDVPVNDIVWEELIANGKFCEETQRFFVREYWEPFSTMKEQSKIMKSSLLEYARLLGYIHSRDNIKVGAVCLFEIKNSIDAEVITAFNTFLDKLDNEVRNVDYYNANAKSFHEGILIGLLDGTVRDPTIFTPHIQTLYDQFDDYIYMVVIDISKSTLHVNNTMYYKYLFDRMFRAFKVIVYENYIVMVISSRNSRIDEKLFFNIPGNPFEQNNLYVGISSSFENLYHIRVYYDEAVEKLKDGLKKDSGKHIFLV